MFAADADVRRVRAIEACRARGLAPLHPLDNEAQTARDIYEGNVALIREADVVVANLNPFRGPCEPDAGTAFEVGFACALDKPVWAYADEVSSMRDRMGGVDARGYNVEDFDLPMNLMLAESVTLVQGSFEDCLDALVHQVSVA